MELARLQADVRSAKLKYEQTSRQLDLAHQQNDVALGTVTVAKYEMNNYIFTHPNEPTLGRLTKRWAPAFAEYHVEEAIATEDVLVSYLAPYWLYPNFREAGQRLGERRMQLTHRKLVALCSIDRWFRRHRDAILAWLYRPGGRMAQVCIRRAIEAPYSGKRQCVEI
jgi:hypothetical protein